MCTRLGEHYRSRTNKTKSKGENNVQCVVLFFFLPERGSKNMNTFAHTFICLNKTQAVKINKHPCSSIQEGEKGVKATRGKLYFLCCIIHLTEEPANALANSKTKLNMSIYHIVSWFSCFKTQNSNEYP